MGRQRLVLSMFTIVMLVLSTVATLYPAPMAPIVTSQEPAADNEETAVLTARTFLGDVYDAVVLQEYVDLQYEALEATVHQLEVTGFGDQLVPLIDRVLATGRLVVLFFHAEWCYVCELETPIVDVLERAYADRVCILRVDGPRNPDAMRAFGVAGYPTVHLVYGRDAQGLQHVDFVGYTPQARLEAAVAYVLAQGTAPPRDDAALIEAIDSLLTEWPHHTCDVDDCLGDCQYSEDMYQELSRIAYELVRLTGECALCAGAIAECVNVCTWTVAACAASLGVACGLVALCVGCFALVAAAEFMPGPSCLGCLDDFSHTGDAIDDLWETLEACDACCDDPMTCEYGPQECKDPALTGLPDADRCVGNTLVSMTCQECEWATHPGSTFTPCPEGSHCVETSITMAECRPKDEDDDGDDCTGTDCRDDEDDDGDGDDGPSSGPGGDHPDDNQILATTGATVPDLPLTIPQVAVLRRGYYEGTTTLLASLGEVTTLLDFSFPQDLAAQYPVLVIPSGGLYGLGQSTLFREKLEEYVEAGGALIVLSQQNGDDYHALPGGSVDGFGWIEDQSCQSQSVAMSVYHPFLSGLYLFTETLDLRVDGFFTTWPEESLVLLERVKNGKPAVLMYPYGNGRVIATTLFTDYNVFISYYDLARDERPFFRNLITWAKKPQPMPDYSLGATVTISLNLTNPLYETTFYPVVNNGDHFDVSINLTNGGTVASSYVSFILIDSTYQLHYLNTSVVLAPNETRRVPVTVPTGAVEGVWYVLYGLFADDHPIWADVAGAFTIDVNLDTLSTYTVVFTLIDPAGAVEEQRNVTVYVDGSSTSVNFTHTSGYYDIDAMGIWSLDYVVYNYREEIVDFGVKPYAVSLYQRYPTGWRHHDTELTFSVTSDREDYLYGTPANFTFHLWNDGSEDVNVTVTWGVFLHANYGVVPEGRYDAFTAWVVVPALGYASFNYTLPNVVCEGGDQLRAKFYVNGSCVGSVAFGFYAYDTAHVRANLDFDMTLDNDDFRSGDSVNIHLNVTSRLNLPYDALIKLRAVHHQSGVEVWNTTFDAHILNGSTSVWNFDFTLPLSALDGRYDVTLTLAGWRVSATSFHVLPYDLAVTVNLPDTVYPHASATGTLTLNNTGDQNLRNATVTLAFLDPDQRIQWNATATFPVLAIDQTATLPFTIPVSDVHLGPHQFVYHVTFNPQKMVFGTIDLLSSLVVELAFDRASYRAREDVGVTVDVVNDGVFVQNRSLRLDVPDIGYTEMWDLHVLPDNAQRVDVVVPLPSNITVGVHDVHLAVQDDGNWTVKTYRFPVPESQLRVALAEARYNGGDDAQVVLWNLGGVHTDVEYAIALLGPTGSVAPTHNATVTILAGASVGTTYPLPRSLLTGPYVLRVATRNARTNTTQTTQLPHWIDGVSVDVAVATDRDVYGVSDPVEATSQLTNTGAPLENGTLHLDIVAALPSAIAAANWTTYVALPIGLVDVIAFDQDGNAWLGGYGFVVRYRDGAWDHYTIQDGLPGSIITSLVVDASGQVWVGADSSTAGLSVFDGAGWTRLNETNTGLAFPFTTALAIGPDGDVWVGSRSGDGVHRFNGTHWTTYNTTNSGMVSNRVGCIAVDDDGTVWFGGGRWDEYGVTMYNGTHWTTYDASHSGIKRDRVDAVTFDLDGNVWIAHDHYLGGISVYNGTNWTTYQRAPSELPDYAVRKLAVNADGYVWAATGGGVAVFNGTAWTRYSTDSSGLESNDVVAIVIDEAGQVWVGFDDVNGVSHWNGSRWSRLVPSIIDDRIYDVTVDEEGVVWFATHGGISRYDGNTWTYFTATTSGLLNDRVYVLDYDNEGNLWAGTGEGISTYNGSGWTSYDAATTGVDLAAMAAFTADPYGNLWFASTLKTGLVRFNGTHWTSYNTTTSGLASDDVRALLVDAYGELWIATAGGVNWYNGTHWRLYNASYSPLSSDDVTDLALDAQNRVWIVHALGVNAFDRTTWTTFDPQLFEDLGVTLGFFSAIALDARDQVWVSASRIFTGGGRGHGVLTYDGSAWTKYNVTNSGLASNFVTAFAFTDEAVWFGTDHHGACMLTTAATEPSPVLWQANVTFTLPESAVNTTTIDVDPLSVTGKLYLRGHLHAERLLIAMDVHPFYVVDGDFLLTFDLDDAVYALGDTVTVTGALRNLDAAQAYDGLTVTIRDGATLVYQASVDLPANGSHPVATSFVAASAGAHTLEVTVARDEATLLTLLDQYTVAVPSVVVEVTAPEVVGWDPFPVTVHVNNTGVTDATVTVNGTTLTLAPGAVQFLELTHQVDQNMTYALIVTGDYDATLLVDVVLGASANMTLTPAPVYREGFVAIPYAIVNTGPLDINTTVTFTLDAFAESRNIYVPAMQTLTGQLLYNLTEGAYTLGYSTVFDSGHVAFTVVTPNRIDVTVHDSERVNGTLRVPVTVTNVGVNTVTGTVRFRSDVYTGEESLTLPVGASQSVVWNLSLWDIPAGTYNVTVQVLAGGAVLQEDRLTVHVTRPQFNVVDVPVDASFPWGVLANLTVTVRNAGDAAGGATVTLTMPGIHEAMRSAWIPGGSAFTYTFPVPIPDDVAAGWYPAVFALNGVRHETAVFVEGANVSVTASPDQTHHVEGANATVTLRVANRNGLNLSLVARVRSNAYEVLVPFNLSSGGDSVLTFDVPVGFEGRTSQTVLYTVSLASGRALYIDDLYLYAQPPPSSGIMLSTDRQVYAIGDTVTVTVNASRTGVLNASAPNFAVEASIDGVVVYTFTVPPLRSGAYAIDYTFDGYTGSYPFDVDGYAARIVELALDKASYAVGEDVHLTMGVEARRAFAALLRVTVYDQFSVPIDRYSVNVTLMAGANRITVTRPIPLGGLGLYAINPRIYVDLPAHSYVLVTSGARFFDVTADAVPPVLTITTPTNATYLTGTIWLNVTLNEAVAWMGYSLDGDVNITMTEQRALLGVTLGSHAVTVYANDASGNLGASTVAFTVTSVDDAPPDPVVLATPSGVTHEALTLSWTETTAVDFANYTVYQSTVQGSLGIAIVTITDASTTTYSVTGLTPEMTYHFTVRITDTGGLSADSNTVSATTTAAPLPPPPEFPWIYLIAIVAVIGVVAVVLLRKSIV